MRVQILKDYVKQHFPATPLLDYALEVEKITTSKVGSQDPPSATCHVLILIWGGFPQGWGSWEPTSG